MRSRQIIFAILASLVAMPVTAQNTRDFFRLASSHYQRANWPEAIENFRKVLAEPGAAESSAETWFYLAEAQSQIRDWSEAQANYAQFLKRFPRHPFVEVANYRQVEIGFLGRRPDAVRLAESYIQNYRDPHWRPAVFRMLGELRLENQEPQLAFKVFETATQEFPNHALSDEFQLGLANARIMMNESMAARSILQPVVENRNDNLGQRARLLLAICDYHANDWDSACDRLRAILDSKAIAAEQVCEVYFWLGRCEAGRKDWSASTEAYQQAVLQARSRSREHIARLEFAHALIENKEYGKAQVELTSILEDQTATQFHEPALATLARTSYIRNELSQAANFASTYADQFPTGTNRLLVDEVQGRIFYNAGDYLAASEIFKRLVEAQTADRGLAATWSYFLGNSLLGCNRIAEAISVFRTVDVSQLPEDSREEFCWTLAKSEMALGNLVAAKAGFEIFQSQFPKSPRQSRVTEELGWLAIRLDDFAALQKLWPQLVAADEAEPIRLEFWQLSGDLAFQNKDWALAVDCYRRLADPKNDERWQAAGWCGLAWTALEQRELPEARRNFERLVTYSTELATVREGYLPLADLLDRSKEWNQAVSYYELAANLADKQSTKQVANLKRAIALQKLEGREQLELSCELLAELDSENPLLVPRDQVLYRWAWVVQELGDHSEASRLLERFLKENDFSDLWPDAAYRLAQLKLQANADHDAVLLLEQSLSRQPPVELTSRIQFLQAQLAARNKDWNSVAQLTQHVIEASPEPGLLGRAEYWLAESHFQLGHFEDALELYQKLSSSDSQLESTLQPWANLRLVQSLAAAEKYTEAIEACDRFAPGNSGFEASFEFDLVRGRCLFGLGKITDAIKAYESVVSNPSARGTETAAQAHWRIGEAHFHREEYKSAIDAFYLTESLYVYPHWRAAALLEAGKCQEQLGNWSHALKLYRELIQRFPTSEFARPTQERIQVVEGQAKLPEDPRR